MPELTGLYATLCELAGGGDLEARFLAQWCPPSYISGCAQAIWLDPSGQEGPLLARNYDYAPGLLEGIWLSSSWLGRRVLAMSDCLWGGLDGINEDGLAISLSFGGRTAVGEGFGIPLVMRYVLETAANTAQAIAILQRLPVHMTYSISLLDRNCQWATVFVAPDRATEVVYQSAVANHQHGVEWLAHARATLSEEREWMLSQSVRKAGHADEVLRTLLRPPLFQTAYGRGYGTLYTAAYHPQTLMAELLWPDMRWSQHCLATEPGLLHVRFDANHLT